MINSVFYYQKSETIQQQNKQANIKTGVWPKNLIRKLEYHSQMC